MKVLLSDSALKQNVIAKKLSFSVNQLAIQKNQTKVSTWIQQELKNVVGRNKTLHSRATEKSK